jgi:hypothetical protein
VGINNCYNTGTVTNTKTPTNNGVGGIVGITTAVNLPVNCYTLTGTDYNDLTATIARVKTEEELKAAGFVTTINNSQNPAKWKADYGTPINGGYPLLAFMPANISTGIASSEINIQIVNLFPVPVAKGDVLTVSLNSSSKNAALTIVDLQGRVLKQLNLSGKKQIKISTSDLKAGVYFVNLNSAMTNTVKRFIVK